MAYQQKTITIVFDFIPNLLKNPQQKEEVYKLIRDRLESKIDEAIARWSSLPPIMVHHGEYCDLLMETRDLFVQGYFYPCVAMCGIVAERIIKDIFLRSVFIASDNKIAPPNEATIKDLESFGAKEICKVLIDSNVIDKKLHGAFDKLGELRNKYAHATGKEPETDARTALDYLHSIIEGTVSLFKDYDIQNGKLVQKPIKSQ